MLGKYGIVFTVKNIYLNASNTISVKIHAVSLTHKL